MTSIYFHFKCIMTFLNVNLRVGWQKSFSRSTHHWAWHTKSVSPSSLKNVPSHHLFRFFHIKHFIQQQFPHFPNCPPEMHIDHFLDLNIKHKRLISVIYNLIHSNNVDLIDTLKDIWAQPRSYYNRGSMA